MSMRYGSDTADREHFERLYDSYERQVHAYCARRTLGHDAGDAASETFLVAWRRLSQVPDEPDTLPYLYGIASKVLSNQRRSEGRRARLLVKLSGLGVTPVEDPVTVIGRNDEQRRVEQAVRRLRPKDREIVMLYAWEELPRKQIAQMMGMTKGAIDQRIHRSYKRLARILGPAVTRNALTPPITEKGGTT